MSYNHVTRPTGNPHRLGDEDLNWDQDLESSLVATATMGTAIEVPLWVFHSSPAKGRLWKKGWKVKHRRIDNHNVLAWVEHGKSDQGVSA